MAKRNVELRLAEVGVEPAQIVAQVSATRCLMCALEDQQAGRGQQAPGA